MNKKNVLFVIEFILLILVLSFFSAASSKVLVQYNPPSSSSYLSSQGISLYSPTLDNDKCQAGQDFIVQIAPLGCEPAVVRSDLLEENNVPVFCQLAATKINPLIDVNAIDRISFQGNKPAMVQAVGFHPAQIAVKSTSSSVVNSPVLNNIGYAVIVLAKQQNESSMPDFINGTMTAVLKYDVKNAFGVGDAVYYLPEILDDSEWKDKYKQYGFWGGKGYLRTESVDSEGVTIGVYSDSDTKIRTVRLDSDNKKSEMIYVPGLYCLAGFNLNLNGFVVPDTRAQFDIEGESVSVVKGEKFLDNKCWITREPEKRGLVQKVEVRCSTDEGAKTFSQVIAPKVSFSVDEETKELTIGDRIKDGVDSSGKKFTIYFAYLDKNTDGKLIAGILKKEITSSSADKLTESELSAYYYNVRNDFSNNEKIIDKSSKGIYYLSEGIQNSELGITLVGYGSNEDARIEDSEEGITFKDYFNNAVESFKTVIDDFPDENKYPTTNYEGDLFSVQAYCDAISLAYNSNQMSKTAELCTEFKKQYPDSFSSMSSICDKDLLIANAGSSVEIVSINGYSKAISLIGVEEPTEEEYSAEIFIDGEMVTLSKNEPFNFRDNEQNYIQLVSLDDNNVKIKINIIGDKTNKARQGTITLTKGVVESIGGKSVILDKINLKKNAKVSLTANIKNAETKANFSFHIGIEKRAISLTPEEAQKKVIELNKSIAEWENRSESLGKVVKGFKAACIGTQAFLVGKSFFAGLNGETYARQQVMTSWRDECTEEIKGTSLSMQQCLLKHNDDINLDVKNYAAIKNKYDQLEITKDNIGEVYSGLPSDVPNPKDPKQTISTKNLNGIFTEKGLDKDGTVSRYDAKRLMELNNIVDSDLSEGIKKNAEAERYSILERIQRENQAIGSADNLPSGFSNVGTTIVGDKNKILDYTSGGKTNDGNPVQRIVYNGNVYYAVLKSVDGKTYTVENVLDQDGTACTSCPDEAQIKNYAFKTSNAKDYKNNYKDPEIRYYETGSAKGYPQIVPFDVSNGWYAATKPYGVLNNLQSYTEAGQAVHFYIGNVMANGREEFDISSGDDVYMSFDPVTGVVYGTFPGLDESATRNLVKQAMSAIQSAQKQYKKGLSGYLTINGQRAKVGNPSAAISGTNCEDLMSPEDCTLLFNVCDPVVCPSSRCNLGGNYYVDDVVQSGIIGSLALCLPNFGSPSDGKVVVPVCLTGLKAGLDGLISIMKNYRDCLQENVNTGKYVGVCDEVYSIYMCEFFWKQALPMIKFGSTWLFDSFAGKGGSEYMGMSGAWNGAEASMNYFTQYYAANSYAAFKARTTDEAGTEICKNFISARYPASGEFFDALLEPDSPSQYHAWFSETQFTDATVPPTSQYKVFYHIFAGKDIGANYQVYLKSPEGISVYHSTERMTVASGYVSRGEYKSETLDLIAPKGYQQLCISINAKEECGFKQVTTSFALDYLKDEYAKQEVENVNINSEEECISGSANALALANPNLQAGAEEAINPNIRGRGIVRVCSTNNPGMGTDIKSGTENSRWLEVGTCGTSNLKCWLDTNSVDEAIDINSTKTAALQPAVQNAIANYNKQLEELDMLSENDRTTIETSITSGKNLDSSLNLIDHLLDKVILMNQKAQLYLWKGQIYSKLTTQEKRKANVVARSSAGEDDDPCNKYNNEADCGGAKNCYWDYYGYPTKCITNTSLPTENEETEENEEPVEETVETKTLACNSEKDCQKKLGEKIIEIASKRETEISPEKLKEIPSTTGANSFGCLVLQVAMQESGIMHCNYPSSKGNALFCEIESNDVTQLDNAEVRNKYDPNSFGVMQINLNVHKSSLDNKNKLVGVFEDNLNYGIDLLINGYNSNPKKFEGNSRTYSTWQYSIRSYNGWGTTGNDNYVQEVINNKNEVGKLFPNCA